MKAEVLETGEGCETIVGGGGAPPSTLKVSGVDCGLTLPAPSAAVAVTVCDPAASAKGTGSDQPPELSAVVDPIPCPSRYTVMTLSAVAVPEIVGRASPLVEPLTGAVIVGAAGATVWTVKSLVAE